jgi:eukaryotic-like serine/threonine-protein kinase
MTVVVDDGHPLFELQPGQRVGSYEVVAALGGGGMGMVYRAAHLLLDRPAAIKVLRAEYGHLPVIVQRFFTEAKLTTAIRHPGIVEVYDFGYTDAGHAYIAMELLAGDSLARRIASRGRLRWAEAAVLGRRITAALAAAHLRGVVHRDLKPDNIHLVPDPDGGAIDQIKILDFGIAKLVERDGPRANLTTTGVVMGTPAYMAPEQCRGLSGTDHRVDLYALGCVLYEMLAGVSPFSGETGTGLLIAHLNHPAPDVRRRALDAPPALARLIGWLLAKDPDARPANAEVVLRELDALIGTSTTAANAIAPRRLRRLPVIAASAVVTAAAAVALALALVGRDDAASPPPPPPPQEAPPPQGPSLPPVAAAAVVAPEAIPDAALAAPAPDAATPPAPDAPPRRRAAPRRRDAELMIELGEPDGRDPLSTTVPD